MKAQEKLCKIGKVKSQKDAKNDKREKKDKEDLKHLGKDIGGLSKNNDHGKLEWMYKNSKDLINREEYLMGRAVDKSFENLQHEESQQLSANIIGTKQPINHVEHECVPFSIRSYKNAQNTEQVDLQRKVMEDPLMLIKQRELESRRKILENPVKLKILQEAFRKDGNVKNISDKSRKVRKHKKNQKKRKRKSSTSSSFDSEDDLNGKLSRKLRKNSLNLDHNVNGNINLSKLLDVELEVMTKELHKAKEQKSRKHKRHHKSKIDFVCKTNNTFMDDKLATLNFENLSRRNNFEKNNESEINNTLEHKLNTRNINKKQFSRSRSKETNYSTFNDYKAKYKCLREQGKHLKTVEFHHRRLPIKIDEDERERKLKEMISNATWREEERSKKVKKHREAYVTEEEAYRSTTFDKNFYNKEMKKALDNCTTISNRVKSNVFNIQRNASEMNENFIKK